MPIQTSQITTDTNSDLTIAPNGTGETKVASVDVSRADGGTGEDTPVAVAQDGTIKKTDLSTLPEVLAENLVSTDLIAVQRNDDDFYYIDASSLAGGGEVINPPTNATLIINPVAGSGSGTSGDPWVLAPITVSTPGGTGETVEEFSVTNAPPNAILFITFTSNAGGRFRDLVKVSDANGDIAPFRLTYVDDPASTAGTVYVGQVRFGPSSEYATWSVTQATQSTDFVGSDGVTPAPNASPAVVDFTADTKFGEGKGNWADGAVTLSATGDIEFKVNSGLYQTGTASVVDNDLVTVAYDQAVVDAAAEGDTISGSLTSAGGTYNFSMVKDITPSVPDVGSGSDVSLNSTQESNVVTPTEFNATISVTAGTAGSNEMTSIQASIDGGAYVNLPTTMYPGQSVQIRGTVGSANSTTYTANVNIGNTAVTYSASTTATSPAVQKPTITYPTTTTTGSVVSDTYTPLNGAGAHQDSDWEVYEAGNIGNLYLGRFQLETVRTDWNIYAGDYGPLRLIKPWSRTNYSPTLQLNLGGTGGTPTNVHLIDSTDQTSIKVTDGDDSTFVYVGKDGEDIVLAYHYRAAAFGDGDTKAGSGPHYANGSIQVLGGVDDSFPLARLVVVTADYQALYFDQKNAAWNNPQTFTANYTGYYRAIYLEQVNAGIGRRTAIYKITIDGSELIDGGQAGNDILQWTGGNTHDYNRTTAKDLIGVFADNAGSVGADTGLRGRFYAYRKNPSKFYMDDWDAGLASYAGTGTFVHLFNMYKGEKAGTPTSDPPGANYSLIHSKYNSTSDLENTFVSNMSHGETYYARVKYRSNDPVESDWSDWKGWDRFIT